MEIIYPITLYMRKIVSAGMRVCHVLTQKQGDGF